MITLTYSVIANLSFGQIERISGFGGISGIVPPSIIGTTDQHPHRLYYLSLVLAVLLYALVRYLMRTPFGLSLQGVRDEPVRMSSLGYSVALHRTLAFTFGAFMASIAGLLFVWWNGHVDPQTIGLGATLNVLIIAVIGGLRRIEGAFVGRARLRLHQRPPGRDRLLDRRLQARHVQLADRPDLPRHRAALARRPARPLGARNGPAQAAPDPRGRRRGLTRLPPRRPICQASCPPTQRRTRT